MPERIAQRRRRGEERRIRLDVRVNAAEHRELKQRADQAGVSVARLLVDSGRGEALPGMPDEQAPEAVPEPAGTSHEQVEAGVARRRPRAGSRPIRLEVRVTESEHRGLAERAEGRGVSVARLLIDSALGVPPLPPARHALPAGTQERFDQLDAAWRGLDALWKDLNSRVGNNLNQLAHIANETGQSPSYELLASAVGELEVMRRQVIEAIGELHRAGVRIGRSAGR
jgi:predicted HicB family RNase H-like nuclease